MKLLTKSQNGFTLVELLIALVVFSVGVLGVGAMQLTSITGNSKANRISQASNLAADRIETFLALDYSDLVDVTGDGTGQDTSDPPDGLDNSGGNFGLDNATVATADGNVMSTDGNYQIFWNVAIEHPNPNTKTINVIVL